jgi:hypothetical protein
MYQHISVIEADVTTQNSVINALKSRNPMSLLHAGAMIAKAKHPKARD